MLCAALAAGRGRSVWLVVLLGYLPQAPIQLALGRAAAAVDEPAWGFVMAGAGAAAAAAGSAGLLLLRPAPGPRAGD